MLRIGPSLNTAAARKTLAKGRVSNSIKDKGLKEELKKLAESYSKGSLSETNLLKEVDKLSKTKSARTIAGANTNTKNALLLFVILMVLTNFATTVGDTPTGKDKKKGTDTKKEANPTGKAKPKDKPAAKKPEDKATKPVKGTTKSPETKKKGEPPKAKTVAQFLEDAQAANAAAKLAISEIDKAAQKKIADLQLGIQGLKNGIKELEKIIQTLKTGNAQERRAAFKKYYKEHLGQIKAMGGAKLTEATVRDKYAPESIANLEEGIKEEKTKIAGIRTKAEKDKAGHQAAVDDAKARGKAAIDIQSSWHALASGLKGMRGAIFVRLAKLKECASHKELKELEKVLAQLTGQAKKDTHVRFGSGLLFITKLILMRMEQFPKDFGIVSPNPRGYILQAKKLLKTVQDLDKKIGGDPLFPKEDSDSYRNTLLLNENP